MPVEQQEALTAYLEKFATEERKTRMRAMLAQRIGRLRIVLEDIQDPHNASACVRTTEIFGVQHLHNIQNRHKFFLNRDVAMGAHRWMTLHRYSRRDQDNTAVCLQELKDQGFLVVATALQEDTVSLYDLPVDRPLAVCFGNESNGASPKMLEMADLTMKIPMYGFTQSFNISVSAALSLQELTRRIRLQEDGWQLPDEEQRDVYLHWLWRTIARPELHLRVFLREHA
ncbi:MAG: tRNA (guanosine-2'-O-)-methyltransferase [Puniceicoccaceae bacterium 5H]|nr:MAG: tRNA (guanosine-2'-O-)-methyltransferase [Puniceicoccaceae bacterium 5H]